MNELVIYWINNLCNESGWNYPYYRMKRENIYVGIQVSWNKLHHQRIPRMKIYAWMRCYTWNDRNVGVTLLSIALAFSCVKAICPHVISHEIASWRLKITCILFVVDLLNSKFWQLITGNKYLIVSIYIFKLISNFINIIILSYYSFNEISKSLLRAPARFH